MPAYWEFVGRAIAAGCIIFLFLINLRSFLSMVG